MLFRRCAVASAFVALLRTTSARVVLSFESDSVPLTKRVSTCGGIPNLKQCGAGFADEFCCGVDTDCVLLNTTPTITAALCCPAGQDCTVINTISCDATLQNATINPGSQLHSKPTVDLEKCNNACCPMGYKCQGSTCVALPPSGAPVTTSSSRAPSSPTATDASTAPSSTTPLSEFSSHPAAVTQNDPNSSSDSFSGTSFAAGFIPGIVIGSAAAVVLFLCLRRRRRKQYTDEKHKPGRDTLTDLHPDIPYRRPTVHGRSISEPTVDSTFGSHRTDFLNHSPPSHGNPSQPENLTGYIVNVDSPPSKAITPTPAYPNPQRPRQKGLFSHSPFVNQVATPKPTQSPIASHLKRGTLSFKISPVRGLKKQRSMHSLHRQAMGSSSRSGPEIRSDSTETIKVIMPTPGEGSSSSRTQEPTRYKPHFAQLALPSASDTSPSWQTTTNHGRSGDRSLIDDEPDHATPTRPGRNSNIANIGASLRSPFTPKHCYPSQDRHADHHIITMPGPNSVHAARRDPAVTHKSTYGDIDHNFLAPPGAVENERGRSRLSSLFPPPDNSWRQTNMTTWGGMMEKAGLRKSALCTPGGDPRQWNKDTPGWRMGR